MADLLFTKGRAIAAAALAARDNEEKTSIVEMKLRRRDCSMRARQLERLLNTSENVETIVGLNVRGALIDMSVLRWYACVYESERCIIHGRAPEAEDTISDDIKRSLLFHDLIGLQSKVFLRDSRLLPTGVTRFCEKQADKNKGDYGDYKVIKLDLRDYVEPTPPTPK